MLNSAAARERELYRYYHPDDAPATPSGVEAKRASNDPCLTAFAQLGAQRLNARRGIITLSTATTDFMLAESGKGLSLQRDNDQQDELWHGVGALKCPTSTHRTIGAELSWHFCGSDDAYIVLNDLTKIDIYKEMCIVVGKPFLRFIAAVPLRTPNSSVVIGNYIVADDKPRDGLSASEIEFMTDMGITVMDYLEAGLLKRKQHRAERMVKAIGLFIEGKSTLREWWMRFGHKSQQAARLQHRKRQSAALGDLADVEFGVQDPIDNLPKALEHWPDDDLIQSVPQSPSSSAPSKVDFGDGRPMMPRGENHFASSGTTATQSTLVSKSWKDRNSSVTTLDNAIDPQAGHGENRHAVTYELPPPQLSDDTSKDLPDDLLSIEIKSVFARVSNLIKEAIGVQGVIFFDASVGAFGASSDRNVMEEKAPGRFQLDHAPTSSEDEPGHRLPPKVHFSEKPDPDDTEQSYENCSNILGYSTRQRSSLRGHRPPQEYERLPETILRRLLKRYPHGKIFNFDQEGCVSPSDSDLAQESKPCVETHSQLSKDARAHQRRSSREAEAKAILDVLPGARSVFWFPLWDQSRERWYAGSLVWSTCVTRMMCPTEDLTYLAAFGNSAMAEIARLSAQALDTMKSDFISSISHELRSPLHGVLASVEFLQDTSMTEDQEDMVNNIHASGKVLLDTINHVLDFSKVNRKSNNRSKLPRSTSRRKKRLPPEQTHVEDDTADILILSEEVLESIYAGQTSSQSSANQSSKRNSGIALKESPITIITDIKWHPNWTFEIDRGAWSRILMNLFSNAMKYTKAGFVSVSLELGDEELVQSKGFRSTILLKVKDSGKGISDEFLKHKLFKPFSQEDSLASGTGLGLGIVRHIVQDLGGQIHFDSELGTGTEVTVQLPLASQTTQISDTNVFSEIREVTKGYKFHLAGFDRYPDITETPTGILSPEAEAAMHLRCSIQRLLTNWFGMEATTPAPNSFEIDVITIMESGLGDQGVKDILGSYDHNKPTASGKSIAIVLCASYHPGPRMHTCGSFQVFYMQQPYGPHKAAKILQSAFCQEDKGQDLASLDHEPIPEVKSATPSEPVISTGSQRQQDATETKGSEPSLASVSSSISFNRPTEEHNPQKDATNTQLNELRVLLVEDNEINLKLLIATMRKLRINHSTAINGLEALNAYKDCRGQFDIVFMDISMPVMSGIDSARHIRRFERDEGFEPAKLIALTGAANAATRQEAFASGIDVYLTKPVPMRELRTMLEEFKKNERGHV